MVLETECFMARYTSVPLKTEIGPKLGGIGYSFISDEENPDFLQFPLRDCYGSTKNHHLKYLL